MAGNQPYQAGRHFLQIPGPTNVPDRILRAMDSPTIDHRGPAFESLALRVLDGVRGIFQTKDPVVIYPASGTGAWEAALVNTLSTGDRVLMAETGQFATLWRALADRLGLDVVFLPGDWRHGVKADEIAAALADDKDRIIKAVCCVHNETSTGVASDIAAVRRAMDAAGHPALLMVDTISSLASIDYRHDEWGVDVTIGGSQKGLMLPPGLSFNAVGEKALAAHETGGMTRSYWDWSAMLEANKGGAFPYTPATNLLYGLEEAISILNEEGLPQVFQRHARLAEATRRAVAAWGLETVAQIESERSNSLTAVLLPEGYDADAFRGVVLQRFNMSLGNGLGRLAGKAFRIGHLGDFNDLMLAGTLCGVEMGLAAAWIPHNKGGVQTALDFLSEI
ncbi:MAG: aminotransferase class V-fold PLP-dependent enzyme [Alphaproteobacteria bacterium]|jgi:alanine-glyoxylate transaminase/serine-glyoxylate transaminase/serine-pyruvate transaminase|nr:serine--glyoxylate aminotransferase [Rhodospirillaceae bacterium]MDP6023367.1 aminotransferase class V-fold PLP-dependent enzyme [Alphaproteobacteria bacterium]MDP6255226.1 aminotransferase class V-fold PLP-dependent enzyme [Alphaproteobacteria bacterium]MDP7053864.1 aminotransferase class V-fold PLP-dependent enzyme [Alphaproteobacteria bacterium]MDP7227165.1 aminotransferase class V-fold PLP-dependent enzyme [Alphaproteobacteria bacterium]|tara:strand:- start:4013 stop:5191 length:1179 start_codon:yes stop_codon:yes gene_type:complete